MGTWGSGLYDNDSALDLHADLTRESIDELSVDELAVYVGMRLRFGEVFPEQLAEAVAGREDELDELPSSVRAALSDFLGAPEETMKARARSEELRAVIGSYNDGPRIDPLLDHAGGRAVLERLAARCEEVLDTTWSDLYEAAGDLAALGLLLELEELGVEIDEDKAREWRHVYRAAREASGNSDQGFWEEYDERVGLAFEHLLGGDDEEDDDYGSDE